MIFLAVLAEQKGSLTGFKSLLQKSLVFSVNHSYVQSMPCPTAQVTNQSWYFSYGTEIVLLSLNPSVQTLNFASVVTLPSFTSAVVLFLSALPLLHHHPLMIHICVKSHSAVGKYSKLNVRNNITSIRRKIFYHIPVNRERKTKICVINKSFQSFFSVIVL